MPVGGTPGGWQSNVAGFLLHQEWHRAKVLSAHAWGWRESEERLRAVLCTGTRSAGQWSAASVSPIGPRFLHPRLMRPAGW